MFYLKGPLIMMLQALDHFTGCHWGYKRVRVPAVSDDCRGPSDSELHHFTAGRDQ